MFTELITETQFGRALAIFALALLVGCVFVGGVSGRWRGAVRGAAVGVLGPLVLALWWLHLWFVDHLGVDRWATVGATLGAGAVAGAGLGLLWRRVWRR